MEKITLFLMSYKGLSVLNSIVQNGYTNLISKVIYAEDKKVVNDYSEEIILLCNNSDIPCFLNKIKIKIDTTLLIAISWRWLIKLNKNQKLIVLHDSLLPKYRGFSPLVTALLNKDKEIGVTALFATEEYDKGKIIKQAKVSVDYPLKIEEAIHQIIECYIEIILFLFDSVKNVYKIVGTKQNEKEASYSLWRDEDDYEIDWNWDANYIKTFVDSVGLPYKGASTYLDSEKIRITEVEVMDDLNITNRGMGKVIFINKGKPVIVCGEGLIKISNANFDNAKVSAIPFKKFRTKLGK